MVSRSHGASILRSRGLVSTPRRERRLQEPSVGWEVLGLPPAFPGRLFVVRWRTRVLSPEVVRGRRIDNAQGRRGEVREQWIAPPLPAVLGVPGTMRGARATVRLEMPGGLWHPSVVVGAISRDKRRDAAQACASTGWHVDQRTRDLPGQRLARSAGDQGVGQGDCRAACPALRIAIGAQRRPGAPAVREDLVPFLQGPASGGCPRDAARTMSGPTQSRVRTLALSLLEPLAQLGEGDHCPAEGRILEQPTDERHRVSAADGARVAARCRRTAHQTTVGLLARSESLCDGRNPQVERLGRAPCGLLCGARCALRLLCIPGALDGNDRLFLRVGQLLPLRHTRLPFHWGAVRCAGILGPIAV
jgi:hypothetical protein